MSWRPLEGVSVVDLSVNAPGPFASTLLADFGADVTVIDNPRGAPDYAGAADDPMLAGRGGAHDVLARGKARLALDLKSAPGKAAFLARIETADVALSEMRPGKLEALGLGWDVLRRCNPRLILCEITGYGRAGRMAPRAGHDLNYLALAGVQSLIRDEGGKPIPPQNLIGDYAAGGSLAVGAILAALLERGRTGVGKRLTLSMTEGTRYLASDIAAATLLGGEAEERWRGTLSGAMPTYGCYQTACGGWIAVGALEPKFIAILGDALDWPELASAMNDKCRWPDARKGLEARFAAHDRAHWEALFRDLDACVTPVLGLDELGETAFDRVVAAD